MVVIVSCYLQENNANFSLKPSDMKRLLDVSTSTPHIYRNTFLFSVLFLRQLYIKYNLDVS